MNFSVFLLFFGIIMASISGAQALANSCRALSTYSDRATSSLIRPAFDSFSSKFEAAIMEARAREGLDVDISKVDFEMSSDQIKFWHSQMKLVLKQIDEALNSEVGKNLLSKYQKRVFQNARLKAHSSVDAFPQSKSYRKAQNVFLEINILSSALRHIKDLTQQTQEKERFSMISQIVEQMVDWETMTRNDGYYLTPGFHHHWSGRSLAKYTSYAEIRSLLNKSEKGSDLPTLLLSSDLTPFDFNYLAGLGFNLVSFPGPFDYRRYDVTATMHPIGMPAHDLAAHPNWKRRFSEIELQRYHKMLSRIDQLDQDLRAACHALVFLYTHESPGSTKNAPYKAGWANAKSEDFGDREFYSEVVSHHFLIPSQLSWDF